MNSKLRTGTPHSPITNRGFLDGENPEIVYIGTGQYGDLPLTPETKTLLSRFETVILPTPEILDMLEHKNRTFVAIIHVMC